MTILLTNEDAEELLSMKDCIGALEAAYLALAEERAVNGRRSDALAPSSRAESVYSLKVMSAILPAENIGVIRLNSDIVSFANQRQKKIPLAPGGRYTGLVLLFSTETGEPLAIFPDGVLQRMRVGATSALAAKFMARTQSHTVAVLGAGWQAGGHVMAITASHKIAEVRCYSPTAERRDAFCRDMSKRTGVPVRSAESPESAVKGADIVLCATNASRNVFLADWLEPGMHVCTIRGQELEPAVVQRAGIVVVHEQVAHENVSHTRRLVVPPNRHAIPGFDFASAPALADVVAGKAKGRTQADQVSCFVNLPGIGLQFAAVGAAFYRKAIAAKRGREMPTEWFTEDVVP
jgi:alanine dehydrogenase